MSKPAAIIDTSVLLCLFRLNILDKLNLLFSEIRVPRKVEAEFLYRPDPEETSERYKFISSFYESHSGWFIQCNEYDSGVVKLYMSIERLDAGESEVFAQNQYLDNSNILLFDEKKARKVAGNKNLSVHGVLFILASLDIKYQLCNYRESIKILHSHKLAMCSEKTMQDAYDKVLNA